MDFNFQFPIFGEIRSKYLNIWMSSWDWLGYDIGSWGLPTNSPSEVLAVFPIWIKFFPSPQPPPPQKKKRNKKKTSQPSRFWEKLSIPMHFNLVSKKKLQRLFPILACWIIPLKDIIKLPTLRSRSRCVVSLWPRKMTWKLSPNVSFGEMFVESFHPGN